MPRGPRLDLPDALHLVTMRGAGGGPVFRDPEGCEDFLARVAALASEGCWAVYAWALLPDHAHLLVRTGSLPLARCMRRLLTGYATRFNRRHRHRGRVFSSRYKSVVVEEAPYFLELVRYLHLNPLRLGLVKDLDGLAGHPYTGHAAILGRVPRSWQDTKVLLARFAEAEPEARRRYEAFVAEGAGWGRRPEFQGGGLVRSLGGWNRVKALRRDGGSYAADERVLGTSGFVERLRREAERQSGLAAARQAQFPTLEALAQQVAVLFGLPPAAIFGPTRVRSAAQARQLLAYLWVERLGRRASDLAVALNRTRGNISWAAKRGARIAGARAAEIEGWWR